MTVPITRRNETGDATVVPRLIDASSPTVMGGLPVHIEELRGHYVAVVATNPRIKRNFVRIFKTL